MRSHQQVLSASAAARVPEYRKRFVFACRVPEYRKRFVGMKRVLLSAAGDVADGELADDDDDGRRGLTRYCSWRGT